MRAADVIQMCVKSGGVVGSTLALPYTSLRHTGVFEDAGYSLGAALGGFSGASPETPGLTGSQQKLIEALQLKEESAALTKEIERLRVRIRALRARKAEQESRSSRGGRYI